MRELNLLITYKSKDPYTQHRLEDECLRKIIEVSDNINYLVTDLSLSDVEEDNVHRKELDSFLEKVDVIFGHRLPKNLLKRAPRLKWFQAMSAGVDILLDDELRNSEVTLTNMSGISAIPVAESAIALMLAVAKNLPLCFEQKQQGIWKQFHPQLLHSKTLGIIGVGRIGREVARLAKPFGMRIIATKYTVRRAKKIKNVDLVLNTSGLPQLLSESDYAVVCLPLTTETRGLISEAEFRTMKPTSCIINISRGNIIDEQALIKALKEKWISAAAFDVFSQEPLPANSELWKLPNLIITPHITGYLKDYNIRTTEFFCDNLSRYLKNKKLKNVVNKKKGF